eukprot:CAMPEP_0113868876 /NCGR_PEP_ID=MMETSP0780_2-20120614/1231_1 /TAXON_ID=652834 /ORGANISM="Palpitomonas bilix" /LENGTH=101 /DNA_ID=CAMNT_0000854005 /DNA_START=300 /DNA_END=605 /DNA_ORIENTATION=+ /assembly_acc=CAM_ASM_000599
MLTYPLSSMSSTEPISVGAPFTFQHEDFGASHENGTWLLQVEEGLENEASVSSISSNERPIPPRDREEDNWPASMSSEASTVSAVSTGSYSHALRHGPAEG